MSGVRPKKHLGQHFLKEDAIARRIVEALAGPGGHQHVIEVGPGTGALTRHLFAQYGPSLTCFEVDHASVAHLRAHFPGLDVRQEDFLTMDPDRVTKGPFAVVGNFPYHISTQILFKVLEHRSRCTGVVGMFQKEVADRIRAPHGSRTYGITSVLVQAWYDVELLFHVEPGSFIPPPKVRSSVIRMVRNDVARLDCDEDAFVRTVKTAFNQRRKVLGNALRSMYATVPERFAGKRAEQLSVAEFIELAHVLAQAPGG